MFWSFPNRILGHTRIQQLSSGHWPGMGLAGLLFFKQGTRSLEDYIEEYLVLTNGSDLPDCLLVDCSVMALISHQSLSSFERVRVHHSLSLWIMLCWLWLFFTVGVAEEERDIASMTEMVAAPEPTHKMAATAKPDRKMADTTVPRHVTAANLSQARTPLIFMSLVKSRLIFMSHVKSQLIFMSHVKSQLIFMRQVKLQLIFMRQVKLQLIFMS